MFSRLWIRFSFAYQVSIQKRRMYSLFSLFGLDWIYFILFIFNWRIIALQCCVSFCCRATWTSCKYTYVPSLLNLPAPPAPSHPSRLSQGTGLSSLYYTASSHWYLLYVSTLLSQLVPHSLSSTVSTNLFCVCIAVPALQIDSAVPFF